MSPDPSSQTQTVGGGPRAAARDTPAVAVWHAAWATAMTLLALGGGWIGAGVEGTAAVGLIVMAAPGLAGLGLLMRDGQRARSALVALWALAAVAAAALSGGISGPLAAPLFMPFVAGVALGGHRRAQGGALGTALAALSGLASVSLAGPGAAAPGLAALAALLTAGAAALAVRLAWRDRALRLEAAEAAVGRVEALLAGQPGLTLVIEPSGRVLAGYGAAPPAVSVDALFDQGLIAAVHAPDRPAVLSAMDKALAGQDAQAVFAPRTALDRRVTLVMRRSAEVGDAGARLIVQAFDGTMQHARELGLETARVEAEAQSAGKTRFLANMSHELRTPLNAVLGFSDIMRQRLFGPLPDKYAEYAQSIHEAGGHLLDLINDVLDMSKIEAERYQLSLERFDAREPVSAAVALVRLQANDKGIGLAAVLPPETVTVTADRRALKQMALNLLSNAIKFTPAGGSATVSLDAIGPYLELTVADTGVGVAPEDLKRLGRPFEQAGGLDQRAQGTGLGLSLVRALAELHGGRMSVDSTLGEGTAVTVRLPVVTLNRPPSPDGGAEVVPLRAES